MERNNRIWELLGRKFSGELSQPERDELNTLMGEKEKEEAEYIGNMMENYADAIQNAPENENIQHITRQSKDRVLGSLREEANPATVLYPEKKKHYWWYAAATIAVLVGLFIYFSQQKASQPAMNVVTTQDGSKSMIVLPDGTQVWLNAGSRLTYPADFKNEEIREVTLSGEAYFKVKHDDDHPFIIHTKYLDIKDLGTAFNVRAYPDEDKSEATLIEGAITVSLKEDPGKKLLLKPGEKLMYSVSENKLVKNEKTCIKDKKNEPNRHLQKLEVTHIKPVVIHPGDTVISEIAWLDNQLVFNNESFVELANRMSRFYRVNIIINNKQVRDYSFTGIFEGETLQQALDELQMIRSFSYSIDRNKVVIDATDK